MSEKVWHEIYRAYELSSEGDNANYEFRLIKSADSPKLVREFLSAIKDDSLWRYSVMDWEGEPDYPYPTNEILYDDCAENWLEDNS